MNIDQLLSLDKADKMTGFLSDNSQNLKNNAKNHFNIYNGKMNSTNMSNQIAFNFLSNYSNSLNSNTASFLKAANQLGLNSSVLENFLTMKTPSNRSSLKNDHQSLQQSAYQDQKNPFNLSMLNDTKKPGDLDENNYSGYFSQLSNHLSGQTKSTNPMNQPINSKKLDANQTQLNNQLQQQQSLAAAVAACYTTSSLNGSLANNSKLNPFAIDISKQNNLSSSNRTNGLLSDQVSNKNFNGLECSSEIKMNRPASENSLNGSVLSTEIDFEFNDVDLINVKRKTTELNRNAKYNMNGQRANLKDDSEEEKSDSQLEMNCDDRLAPIARIYLNGLDGLNERIFNEYQDWAKSTYGDLAKTKTVTRKKYERIVKILNGQEPNNVENSKFRFWVKSKGFRLGSSSNDGQFGLNDQDILYVPCIKSTATGNGSNLIGNSRNKNHSFIYKKVAVVENFFQIIYSVHVEIEGKAGTKNNKHAGQKRTYKAVAESYAFLPREAVTRFLASCKDCQKRMHLQVNTFQKTNETSKKTSSTKINSSNNFKDLLKNASINSNTLTSLATNLNTINTMVNTNAGINNLVDNRSASVQNAAQNSFHNGLQNGQNEQTGNKQTNKELDFNLPITNAYLKQMNRLNKTRSMITAADLNSLVCNNYNYLTDNLTKNCSGLNNAPSKMNQIDLLNEESSSLPSLEEEEIDELENSSMILEKYLLDKKESYTNNGQMSSIDDKMSNHSTEFNCKLNEQVDLVENHANKRKYQEEDCLDNDLNVKRLKKEQLSDEEDNLDNENQTNNALNYSTSNEDVFEFKDTKEQAHDDEEEDDEDEDNNRLVDDVDPDRLKAFNMFVRLFIDENLDRSIPISRQPKEKVQAILESCKRQFPELQNRSRKRIRTYLKSCRRTKKIQNLRKGQSSEPVEVKNEELNSTDDNYLTLNKETLNQPVYHLNSASAEKILAVAFENEILNARRIKDGLSPLIIDTDNGEQVNAVNSSPVRISGNNDKNYQLFNSSLISKLIGDKGYRSDEIDKTLNQLNKFTNNSLENLKIANKGKSLSTLSTLPTRSPSQADFSSLTNKQFKELLSIEQTISTNPLNQVAIDGKLPVCDLLSKLKSNEKFLSNLYNLNYNLNANELVSIKQLITGYRESALYLLKSASELEFLLFQQQQQN